jgi:hypothetical protein
MFPFPNFFFGLIRRCRGVGFATPHSNLSFRRLIPDADRRAMACADAIRSVTHLVPASPTSDLRYLGFLLQARTLRSIRVILLYPR